MQPNLPEVHCSERKTKLTSIIDEFDVPSGNWRQVKTTGQPPLGIRGYACASIGEKLYYFGGFCGHDWCRHNTLSCLNICTHAWEHVGIDNARHGPMKKSRSGMVSFHEDGVDYLCVFGGTGLLCSANQTDAFYIPWKENPDWGWTNEIHIFNIFTGLL